MRYPALSRKRAVWGLGAAGLVLLVLWMMRPSPLPVETAAVTRQTVREFVVEDATTRLAEDILVAMPVSGTLQRVTLKEGDRVETGGVLFRVDPFNIEQQVRSVNALKAQTRARMTGVDVAKPREEELAAAWLRVREAEEARGIAERDLAIAEIDLAEAARTRQRLEALLAQGAVSQAEYDEAARRASSLEAQVDRMRLASRAAQHQAAIARLSARRLEDSIDDNEFERDALMAELERLEADLAKLTEDLAKTEVRAPVPGVVLELFHEDELWLMEGTAVLRLGEPDTLEAECDILSEEVVRVEVGNRAEISGLALNRETVGGYVARIYPAGFKKISALGIEQQRVRTIIRFDEPPGLRPGTSVDVRIITAESPNALAVPERATFRHEDGWALFAIRGGRAALTPVEVGLKNDDWAEVLAGLDEGDMIAAELSNDLEDGLRVRPL